MSVDDIFELGSQLIDSKYCYYSILWLTEALNRIDANETDNLFKLEILDSLALAYETEGKPKFSAQRTRVFPMQYIPPCPQNIILWHWKRWKKFLQ